ncbi:hypothetical protein [Desulfoscipio geothermicus]|uniref:hypothetical protein n=1 Tax=Desulfoscipio geothermicus TaxID=39060 RepID=UPI0013F4E9F1|nr:hypothetical protein [Desulfoscipio geothermicus]
MNLFDLMRQIDPSFVKYESELQKYEKAKETLQEKIDVLFMPEKLDKSECNNDLKVS